MAVKNRDKESVVSVATRTITADGVHIENGIFIDENGNIAERIADLLMNPDDYFKITIKIELPTEEN